MAIRNERELLTLVTMKGLKLKTFTWDFTLQNSASLSPSEQ